MNLQPHPDYVLIRFHFVKEETDLLVPSHVRDDATAETRNRFEIVASGDDEFFACPGDFVILRPDSLNNLVPTSKVPAEGLLHKSAILAIEVPDELSLAN